MFKLKTNAKGTDNHKSKSSWNIFAKTELAKPKITHSHTMANVSTSAASDAIPHVRTRSQTKNHADAMSKRQSIMILSSPVSRTDPQLRSVTRHKYTSHYDFSSLQMQDATDPKELELYSKILNQGALSEDDENDDDEDLESQSFIDAEQSLAKSPLETLTDLSSALEDYKLFTNQQISAPSAKDQHLQQQQRQQPTTSRSSSIPSLTSFESIVSHDSIKQVSNTMWVGFFDDDLGHLDDLDISNKDIFDTFDAAMAFADEEAEVTQQRGYSVHRTSLIFV